MAAIAEPLRKAVNERRLKELNPIFRAKVVAILRDLEDAGERPYIACGFRSRAEQAKVLAGGFSWVSFSYHNCATPGGKPDALAADIVCADRLWNASDSFWLKLASSAEAHGCTSGAFWGLPQTGRAKIRDLIKRKVWKLAPKIAKVAWGKDRPHVEWKGISLSQAKAGVRPKAD